MKVAPKTVILFKDADGLATAFADAFHPNPNSSIRRLEESYELSLDRYGIRDQKAQGNVVHFVDGKGNYEVSILLLERYEPPTLICAVSEFLTQITGEASSILPAFVVPCVGVSAKLKWENKASAIKDNDVSLYSAQIGPETDTSQAVTTITQKAPSSLQIKYEPLACFLQLACALNLPTSLIFGQNGRRLTAKASEEELEILTEMGNLLASFTSLLFSREAIAWNPTKVSGGGRNRGMHCMVE